MALAVLFLSHVLFLELGVSGWKFWFAGVVLRGGDCLTSFPADRGGCNDCDNVFFYGENIQQSAVIFSQQSSVFGGTSRNYQGQTNVEKKKYRSWLSKGDEKLRDTEKKIRRNSMQILS
ncbi:hypothetical protein FF1_026298 [Malus domestica]